MPSDPKRKIIFVDHDEGYTGSSVSLKYMLKYFERRGHYEIILITAKRKDAVALFELKNYKYIYLKCYLFLDVHFANRKKLYTPKGIYSFILMIGRIISGAFICFRLLKAYKPDLIYINEYVLAQFALAGRLLGIPAITHIRSRFVEGSIGFRNLFISNFIYCFNNAIFAITRIEAEQIEKKKLCVSGDKIHIVPEFLSDANFSLPYNSNLREHFQTDADTVIIIMVGGINYVKGSKIYLEAIKEIIALKMNIKFVLVGRHEKDDAGYYRDCMNLIEEINFKKKSLYLYENVNAILEYIAASDILISSSVESHFSRPIIEAWAQKKAVIASDIAHSLNMGVNYHDISFYMNRSHADLKNKIIELSVNKELRLKLGINGFEKAKLYSKDNLDFVYNTCNKLIERNGRK